MRLALIVQDLYRHASPYIIEPECWRLTTSERDLWISVLQRGKRQKETIF